MIAKNILTEWLSQTDQTNFKEGHYFVIEEAMKEYARLKCQELLEIVAEKAKTKIEYSSAIKGHFYDVIDKDSILNAVDLAKYILSPQERKEAEEKHLAELKERVESAEKEFKKAIEDYEHNTTH